MPGSVLTLFENNVLLAILFLVGLAVVLSVCSEADAFVAASFSQFPKIAQLSFITAGPMVDLKLIAMFLGSFKKKIAVILIFLPLILNIVILWLLKGFIH